MSARGPLALIGVLDGVLRAALAPAPAPTQAAELAERTVQDDVAERRFELGIFLRAIPIVLIVLAVLAVRLLVV